ncbi:class I adenylate-forming enzyme family protein [Pseudoramibacter faecis]|uniref:class I adenylate-forming enzyme family protein n=1 Tax=Pseudoramibacter faecis TaxID=3108534 RepID=UPI002E793FF6|nr:class I adenylate-forming enzyme family protein [Pseudoramibacter sp. HA2172]
MASLEDRRRALRAGYPRWSAQTIFQKFSQAAARYSDRIFFQDGQVSKTYAQTTAQVHQAAAAFGHIGVRKGERVAVSLGNCFEYLCVTFALAKLGAVKVPINRRIPADQKCYMLKKTGAVVLVSDKDGDVDCVAQCETLQKIILLSPSSKSEGPAMSWRNFMARITSEKNPKNAGFQVNRQRDVQASDLSDIIFTSGSTGDPKGAMLTHNMLLRSAYANCLNRGFEDGRKVMITVPLFHVYGYIEGLLSVLFVGGTLVCLPGKFDADQALRTIQTLKVNDLICVLLTMQKLLSAPSLCDYNLSTLHAVYCSASVCPKWVWDAIKNDLGVSEVITGYGMSEVSAASVQTPPEAPTAKLYHSVGKILTDHLEACEPLIEYRVVDPDVLADLPAGEVGELICKGAIVSAGYFGDEMATKSAFTEGGWFRSGDLARIDADGYMIFEGRLNESYKINGENVSPAFVDQIILNCKAVVRAETLGMPDEKLGWIGVAFIEPLHSAPETKREIMAYCKKHLADYQLPKFYFFMKGNEWPKTPNGKITKKRLRALAEEKMKEKKTREIQTK